MKFFLSADIEGTAGIALWEETENGHSRYAYFAEQMSREVAAACEGMLAAGAQDILVKDAHDSACNIIPALLPEDVRLFRGWGSDPMGMMTGLESGCDGAFFTGYHSGAGMNTNPLAHTMNRQNNWVKINGEIASELTINCLTAAWLGVPVRMVTGDKGLCDWIRSVNPNVETVAVSEGVGRGSISIHPRKAVKLIREAAERAAKKDARDCMFPMPEQFVVEINFKEHFKAKNAASYPGCVQIDEKTVRYACAEWPDAMRALDWIL